MRATRYPEVVSALVTRALRRSRHIATNMAIVQQPRIDLRLHMLFWELADRWGTVHHDGVHVRLNLTHSMLSDLVAARRPTVTKALGELAARSARGLDRDRLAAARRSARRVRPPRLADDRRRRVDDPFPHPPHGCAKLPTALANVVGQRIRRREDPRFLRGEGSYVDDLSLPGALHLTFVRSYMGARQVNGIDNRPREAAGAQVFAAADTDLTSTRRRRSSRSTRRCSGRCCAPTRSGSSATSSRSCSPTAARRASTRPSSSTSTTSSSGP